MIINQAYHRKQQSIRFRYYITWIILLSKSGSPKKNVKLNIIFLNHYSRLSSKKTKKQKQQKLFNHKKHKSHKWTQIILLFLFKNKKRVRLNILKRVFCYQKIDLRIWLASNKIRQKSKQFNNQLLAYARHRHIFPFRWRFRFFTPRICTIWWKRWWRFTNNNIRIISTRISTRIRSWSRWQWLN